MMKRKQSGFTLIEIAIVLVIIGLLLGGVLKGAEMITQAKIKTIIKDFDGVQTALYAYQDRFKKLPGDDNGAAARWGATTLSGDGDNVLLVTARYNSAASATLATNTETNFFWQHLRFAGFIPGATLVAEGASQPVNAVGGMIGVQMSDTDITLGLGAGLVMCSANLPAKIAAAVDAQLDDGNGATGLVRGQLTTTSNPLTGAAAAVAINYVDNGTNQYLVCRAL